MKPDLTTIAHFAIQLSYYAMSYLQHFLQACAGGLFVLIEGVGVDVQRGGGLAVAEDARHHCRIRAARDHQAGGGVPEGMDVQLLRQAVFLEDQLEAVLLAALMLMGGISVTAYAGGGEEWEYTEPEETTGGYDP